MDVIIIEELSEEVVTLSEVKNHLKVEYELEDAYLTSLVGAAIDFCEKYTKRFIKKKRIEILLDSFPRGPIKLPVCPVQEIVSIVYQDEKETINELDSKAYRAIEDVEPPVIFSKDSWPSNVLHVPGSIRIEAIVGYDETPLSIQQAILLLCGHFFENREVMRDRYVRGSELPFSVSALLYPYKVFRW